MSHILPNEIWEEVFSHVPLVDLLLGCSQVCSQWRDIIANDRFIPNKKLYHMYQSRRVPEARTRVLSECIKYGITSISNCLDHLVKCLLQTDVKKNCDDTIPLLKQHSLYNFAEMLVKEKFAAQLENEPCIPLWGIVGMIVINSSNAWEIENLIKLLISPKSNFSSKNVMEKMYLIAAFLLHFNREYKLPDRHHFMLFHGMHLYENCGRAPVMLPLPSLSQGSPSSGREVKHQMQLTPEQMRIVNHSLGKSDLIKIVAFAGTGKTSTLVHLAKKRPKMRFLILSYNRSVMEDAKTKFPKENVTCKTVHQLAQRYIRNSYRRKNLDLGINTSTLLHYKMLPDRRGLRKYERESLVVETLNRFMASADDFITIAHTPDYSTRTSNEGFGFLANRSICNRLLSMDQKLQLVEDASQVWDKIRNPNYTYMNHLPHDAYLKIWQLRKPENLFETEKVDCIMIDEGQDMNGAMLDIFLRQTNKPRIIVGDPNQQIYQWRYAINALDKVPATHVYYLTQSFRFGPEISFMANSCLKLFKNMDHRCLVGTNICDSINPPSSSIHVGKGKQLAIIGRTNLCLYKKIVQIIGCDNPESKRKKLKIGFAGGFKGYGYDKVMALAYLQRGELDKIEVDCLKRYQNIRQFTKYVIDTIGDMEWAAKLSIVNWSGGHTIQYVNAIMDCKEDDLNKADVIFSTAHKSKGMEWDTVVLLDDFEPNLPTSREPSEDEIAEQNLLYVAVTRAKRVLVINPACHYTLLAVGEKHERVVSSREYLLANPEAKCVSCQSVLPGPCRTRTAALRTLELNVMTIMTGNTAPVRDGILCTLCAGKPCFSLPRYVNCYQDLSFPIVKPDQGHAALGFLTGPHPDDKDTAGNHYEQLGLINDRRAGEFIRARQLVAPPAAQPVLVFEDEVVDPESREIDVVYPEDDDSNDIFDLAEAVGGGAARDDFDLFPDDDDCFLDVDLAEDVGGGASRDDSDLFPDDDDCFPDGEALVQLVQGRAANAEDVEFPNDDHLFDGI